MSSFIHSRDTYNDERLDSRTYAHTHPLTDGQPEFSVPPMAEAYKFIDTIGRG